MYSSMIFLERSRIFDHNVLHRFTSLRHMGGGPRTFPGGLNKWQWKRLHEKQARQKEKRLLDQEKQLYQARVRSEIRSKIANPDSSKHEEDTNSPNYKPLSPKEHIKALADRFMKEGAEDLWNEADGPIRSFSPQEISRIESNHTPINLRKVISGQNHIASTQVSEVSSGFIYNQLKSRHFSTYLCSDNLYSLSKARHYSVRTSRFSYRKNDSSSSEDDDEGFIMMKKKGGDLRGPRLSSIGSSDGEGSDNDDEGRGNRKTMTRSRAALGKYDIKKTKRIPLKLVELENDLSLHVQAIRNEFNKRKMAEKDTIADDDDSILSPKRFDECNVSQLTIKSLTLAGYVQMTKVQDATISACLEGKDVLVKAKTGTGKSAAFLLPAIETVLKASIKNVAKRFPPICVLIVCPTRELASQIAAEANVLLKYHDGIGVQTLVGGTRFKVDQKRLETEPCQIIIATPGRLLDHIENKSGFSARLKRVCVLAVLLRFADLVDKHNDDIVALRHGTTGSLMNRLLKLNY